MIDETTDPDTNPPNSPSMAPDPSRIGEYRVFERIGQGAFGRVYRATDEQLQRQVAIKLPLLLGGAKSPTVEQWMDEARTVARLDHPNIVPIYQVGSTSEHPCFLVTKFIDGVNFGDQLRRHRPPLRLLVEQVASIAEALQHTHSQGLVHRDVKPGNILIDQQQRAWLTDFGIALSDEHVGEGDGPVIIGTIAYMSPEQASGEAHRVDGRADIFSLGVVLYQALTGHVPFRGTNTWELLRNIASKEVRPPRQYAAEIPIELERICLKALMKRPADRFQTAADFAADLRWWLSLTSNSAPPSIHVGASSSSVVVLPATMLFDVPKLEPKGLRAFDETDSAFFLELVPGARGRSGLPDSLKDWKTRIESRDPTNTFSVGLVYGPSGCGKSSFIRAGLIPQLSRDCVSTIYVEATATETESRLLSAIRRIRPNLSPKLDLVGALTALRRQTIGPVSSALDEVTQSRSDTATATKLLLVIDQIEQWLQTHGADETSELVRALRQCDGLHVQVIVMARDDFWMPITRFFKAIDVRLEEGINSRAVDRFDLGHSRRVLIEYGRAYGRLPDNPAAISDSENEFLDMVIDGLQQERKVICIHLVLFAQMMRDREWTPKVLKAAGGPSGIVNCFLEHTFSAATAPPLYRKLEIPIRAILQSLLPEAGNSRLKGRMQPVAHLAQVSRLNPADFAEAIRVLDRELRLITPTTPTGEALIHDGTSDPEQPPCYQLTHDFLVESVRSWLFQKQRETLRGRTQLRLAELAQFWRTQSETRFLPSSWEYVTILMLTRPAERSEIERKFMRSAARHHLVRWSTGLLSLFAISAVVLLILHRFHVQREQERAEAAVAHLLDASIPDVSKLLVEMRQFGPLPRKALQSVCNDDNQTRERQLRARLALLPVEPEQATQLTEELLKSDLDCHAVIRTALLPLSPNIRRRLWSVIGDRESREGGVLRAAATLAVDDPISSEWNDSAVRIAGALLREDPLALPRWTNELRPLRHWLVGPLRTTFFSSAADPEFRERAAGVLADYVSDDGACLAELCQFATPEQFLRLGKSVDEGRGAVVPELHKRLADSLKADARAVEVQPGPVGADLTAEIERAKGIVMSTFAFCQELPLVDFERVNAEFSQLKYQLTLARPWRAANQSRIAAIWHLLEQQSQYAISLAPDEFKSHDEAHRKAGLVPVDVCVHDADGRASPDSWRLAVVWRQPDEDVKETEVYVLVPEYEHESHWQPLNEHGFVPRMNQLTECQGSRLYTSLRVRSASAPVYADTWTGDLAYFSECRNSGWRQIDVQMARGDEPRDAECSSVWWNQGPQESQMIAATLMEDHRAQCRELAKKGFRPGSLSVAQPAARKPAIATSIWTRRPLTRRELDLHAISAVNLAIALMQLGDLEPARSLMRADTDPSYRAHMIDRIASLKTSPQPLASWLQSEKDVTIRITLLLALARFHHDSVPGAIRNEISALARRQMADSPSSGIHAACRYLLQSWNDSELDKSIRDIPRRNLPAYDSKWYINGQGLTMAVIDDLTPFRMGSPVTETERSGIEETPHRRRILNQFAIATHEVTAEQYARFDPDFRCPPNFTPSPMCPVNMLDWFEAARYCRWLSEMEGIAPEEMCFPPVSEIKPGMTISSNVLRKTGYRLPTEAEWELACRAGTQTSRYYGESKTLGDRYGWHINNADEVLHPVGLLIPNERGLFDMYGNTMEWTMSPKSNYPVSLEQVLDDDMRAAINVGNESKWIVRGGAFLYITSNGRSAQRHFSMSASRYPHLGFRPARTLPDRMPPK